MCVCVCEESEGAPIGSLEPPAVKGLWSYQVKSRVACVRLLEWYVNARAAASPLTAALFERFFFFFSHGKLIA